MKKLGRNDIPDSVKWIDRKRSEKRRKASLAGIDDLEFYGDTNLCNYDINFCNDTIGEGKFMKIENFSSKNIFNFGKCTNKKNVWKGLTLSPLSADDADFNYAIGEGGMMRVSMDLSSVSSFIKISGKFKAVSDI
ncbi:MAG: hypothetical protein LBE98_01825 [Puniceicoccales bacterium]|jgi:hypothetical protein|nr:hypothetical protein [Puniceicoccales bacterium]